MGLHRYKRTVFNSSTGQWQQDWKVPKEVYVRVKDGNNGNPVWKAAREMYVSNGTAWKQIWPETTPNPDVTSLGIAVDLFASNRGTDGSNSGALTQNLTLQRNNWVTFGGTINNSGGTDMAVSMLYRANSSPWQTALGLVGGVTDFASYLYAADRADGTRVSTMPQNARFTFSTTVTFTTGAATSSFPRMYFNSYGLDPGRVTYQFIVVMRPWGSTSWWTRASNLVTVRWTS